MYIFHLLENYVKTLYKIDVSYATIRYLPFRIFSFLLLILLLVDKSE